MFKGLKKNASECCCKCGCGTLANCGLWFVGHWNRGRKLTKEVRDRISKGQEGRKRSVKSVQKMLETRKRSDELDGGDSRKRAGRSTRISIMKKCGWDLSDVDGYRQHVKMNNKMRSLMINLLHRCIYSLEHKKSSKTFVELGYTSQQLRRHIELLWEDGMT